MLLGMWPLVAMLLICCLQAGLNHVLETTA
jgi:hypothetical protein